MWCSVPASPSLIAMVGASYAAVPLYYMFCRATGYARHAEPCGRCAGRDRTDRVMDDAVSIPMSIPQLPWSFYPEQRSVQVRVGEDRLVFFRAVNNSQCRDHRARGVQCAARCGGALFHAKSSASALPSSGLVPAKSVDMPVSFFVSPKIMKDHGVDSVSEMTLSYTFLSLNHSEYGRKQNRTVQSERAGRLIPRKAGPWRTVKFITIIIWSIPVRGRLWAPPAHS